MDEKARGTMTRNLSLGFSPCPNDTFIFYGLTHGRIDLGPYRFNVSLADVEVLNHQARNRMLDVTKVSIHALVHLIEDYWLLGSGGAIGRGCGPLVVSREPIAADELRNKTVAVPGTMTTAHLLLGLTGLHRGKCVAMPFDRIMPAVAAGEVDAGIIIHEGRFTYGSFNLRLVLDLGNWWEKTTGLPLPLGGILIKRDLGPDTARQVEAMIRASLLFARRFPDEAWPYIRENAQEMETEVMRQHIEMFVNEFSDDAGAEGKEAIHYMLKAASEYQNLAVPAKPLFWDD
jgi:1,4-dihydroxy-6-naphthoate synthase